jgi:hypothetical protein
MYFWGTLAVLFALACLMGWRMDRRHKRVIVGNAGDSADARANEMLLHNRSQVGGPYGGSI